MVRQAIVLIALGLATAAGAQDMTPRVNEPAATVTAHRPPVTAGDIVDRPYRVIGPVRATVGKSFRFGKAVSEQKVFIALWKQAAEIGADAVILAEYTAPQKGFTKNGMREASGRAIKFLDR